MPDESLAPVDTTDTPAVNPADSTGTPAQEDYETRYKSLQAEYTRSQQENSQYRQLVESFSDPERAAEALAALGYEIEQENTPEPQYDNPYEAELATLKAQLEQQGQTLSQMTQAQQEAAQRAAETQYFESQFEALTGTIDRQLSQQEVNTIVAYAKANPDAEGKPDVRGAWDTLNNLYESEFTNRVQRKKNAPRAPQGQPGAAVPDLTTREGRLHAARQKMAALQDQ